MVLLVCRSAKAWTPGLARGRHTLYPSQLKHVGKGAGKMLLQHRSQFSQPEPSTRRWPDQQLSSVGQELLRINNLFRSPFHLVTTSEARKAVPRGAISTSAQTCFLPGQSVIVGWKLGNRSLVSCLSPTSALCVWPSLHLTSKEQPLFAPHKTSWMRTLC